MNLDANAQRLEEELTGAYGAYAHTEFGDPASSADFKSLQEMIQQLPELAGQLDQQQVQDLAQAMEAEGLELEDLELIPGYEQLDPELQEELEAKLEKELDELELDEVDPEEVVINGMSLKDWAAHAEALEAKAEAFRISAEQERVAQEVSEQEVSAQVETAEAKATTEPVDIQAVNAHYSAAEENSQAAFEHNDKHHADHTMHQEADAQAIDAQQIAENVKGLDAPKPPASGPFGTG